MGIAWMRYNSKVSVQLTIICVMFEQVTLPLIGHSLVTQTQPMPLWPGSCCERPFMHRHCRYMRWYNKTGIDKHLTVRICGEIVRDQTVDISTCYHSVTDESCYTWYVIDWSDGESASCGRSRWRWCRPDLMRCNGKRYFHSNTAQLIIDALFQTEYQLFTLILSI